MIRRALALSVLALSLAVVSPAMAHDDATPTVGDMPDVTLELVEQADLVTNIDQGDAGPSVGDLIIWGPNALLDTADETDTGATTQGVCTAISSGDCLLVETIVFPDGSTLEIQGIQPATPMESTRTIVGGSGIYLGARGTVTVEPTDDLAVWTKTFKILLDD